MKIGQIIPSSNIFCAPMADVTDVAFRILCQKYGAGICCTEMIASESLIHQNPSALCKARRSSEEKIVGAQLMGERSESFIRAAYMIEKDFDFIDINLGCPSTKILKSGCGGALLDKPKLIQKILSELVTTTNKPITIKLRTGRFSSKQTFLEIARIAEKAGVCAITLHARSAEQHYDVKADWDKIRMLKKQSAIPIIGNGDVVDGPSAKHMFDATGCDAIMIGRAAIKDPSLFRRINDYLSDNYLPSRKQESDGLSDRSSIIKEYLTLADKHNIDFVTTKNHIIAFTKGMAGGKRIREELMKKKSFEELSPFAFLGR